MANLGVRNRMAGHVSDVRDDFERMFHQIFKSRDYPVAAAENYFAVVPPIQTWIDAERKEFRVSVPLPGIKAEALNVSLQGNELTVSGEWQDQKSESGKKFLAREFYFDRFARTIGLPDGVDTEKLTCELKNGVLEITAPMIPAALPRKIEVKEVQDKNIPAKAAAASGGSTT